MENESLFLKSFGDTPINRVLDFLIVHEEFDYAMKDIARLSGVGYATLKLFWGALERAGLVAMTRVVGKAKMYRLADSPVAQSFRKFYWDVVRAQTDEIVAEAGNGQATLRSR